MTNTISYRGLTGRYVSQNAKDFRELCAKHNTLNDLTTNIRRADRVDMREFNITASEWHWAVRQAAADIRNE